MDKKLSEYEENLIELVHFLSHTVNGERGLPLKEVKNFLNHKVAHKRGATVIECLRRDGILFINELKLFINETED